MPLKIITTQQQCTIIHTKQLLQLNERGNIRFQQENRADCANAPAHNNCRVETPQANPQLKTVNLHGEVFVPGWRPRFSDNFRLPGRLSVDAELQVGISLGAEEPAAAVQLRRGNW